MTNSEEFSVRGTVFHFHVESKEIQITQISGAFKLVVNIDGLRPDTAGEDAFSTGTIVTMPTPQFFWGYSF